MPKLDFALIAEYVRVEQNLAYLIAGGIDLITTSLDDLPTGINIGLMLRVSFDRTECGRPHRVEVVFQDEDGDRLSHLTTTGTPTWNEQWPVHWKCKEMFGFNLPLPIARYGVHECVILINDSHAKTIQFFIAEEIPPMPEPSDSTG